MKRTTLYTAITAVILIAPPLFAQEDQPAAATTPTPKWCTVETQGTVAAGDLAFVRSATEASEQALVHYFDDPALTAALKTVSVKVVVHASPGALASETKATTRSGTRDGTVATYYAEIHLLAPSAYAQGLLTSIGEPKDRDYLKRLVTHELSTVPLDLATRIKPAGWRFRTAPNWFVQGYEEYLGMRCAPGTYGTESLARRTKIVAAEPDRVDDAFGLDVQGPYVTGAVLLHFMHERYGAARVRKILSSDEPTFGRAVRTALGVRLDDFVREWRDWLADR